MRDWRHRAKGGFMKTGLENFTAEQINELQNKIDFSDIPELTENEVEKGHLSSFTPLKNNKTVSLRIQVDSKLFDKIRATGSDWEKRASAWLEKGVETMQL